MDVGGCWDGHLKVRWGYLRMLIWLVERLVRMLAPLLVLVVIVVVGGSVDDGEDDDWMLCRGSHLYHSFKVLTLGLTVCCVSCVFSVATTNE